MTETMTEPMAETLSEFESERAVLAACLNLPVIGQVRRRLTPGAFWHTGHTLLFEIMLELDDAGRPVDPIAVYCELRDRKRLGDFGNGTYIHALYAFPFVGAEYAIHRVSSFARQRDRLAVATRMAQVAAAGTDPDLAADQLAGLTIEMELLAEDPAEDRPVDGLTTWDAFMAKPDREADAVVPGLLDHQEVAMILAQPGVGKSWLSRQIALTVASGIHPFRPTVRIPPQRTLLIDLENPESTVRRQSHEPHFAIKSLAGEGTGDRAHIWLYPAGLNIRKRPDAALLERVVSETRPDLICIGSLYNVFSRGSSDWDTAAEETIAVFNRIRARYGCALWIEHHMPKQVEGRSMQSPFGSGLWERWPAYGRVIHRAAGSIYELNVFRGDREAGRDFPAGLKRGGRLPWTAIWDRDEVDLLAKASRG